MKYLSRSLNRLDRGLLLIALGVYCLFTAFYPFGNDDGKIRINLIV
jgi:hypothetical protein